MLLYRGDGKLPSYMGIVLIIRIQDLTNRPLEHTPNPQPTVYEGIPFIWGFGDVWGMLHGYVGFPLERILINQSRLHGMSTGLVHVAHLFPSSLHILLNPKYPDPSKVPILRTQTLAIQVATPPLEGPRILREFKLIRTLSQLVRKLPAFRSFHRP